MLRVSPQKLNLVAGLIRGKKVERALADLEFSRRRSARDVRKCLQSAISNAENNHDLDVDFSGCLPKLMLVKKSCFEAFSCTGTWTGRQDF